jgi:hypothetical protein
LSTGLDFDVPVSTNVLEFSFVLVFFFFLKEGKKILGRLWEFFLRIIGLLAEAI